MSEGIKDKVVVITGASSGLGEAATRRLAQTGRSWCWARGALTGFRNWPTSCRWEATQSCGPT